MAADPSETISAALAITLTADSATMIYSFTATVPAKTPKIRRESGALAVQLFPADKTHEKITRGNAMLNEYGIRILVTGEIDATHSRDQYGQLVNEIRASIQDTTLSGFAFRGFETEVEFDNQHLDEFDQFTSITRLTYASIS